jgi:hypothetical protein
MGCVDLLLDWWLAAYCIAAPDSNQIRRMVLTRMEESQVGPIPKQRLDVPKVLAHGLASIA